MQRYHFHLIIAAVFLTVVGVCVAVSVQAQQPQAPGLFQQIRGIFGSPNSGRGQPTPARQPNRRPYQSAPPQYSQPRSYAPQSNAPSPNGARTVGQFFRDLVGEPLPLPGQPRQRQAQAPGGNGPMNYPDRRAAGSPRPSAPPRRSGYGYPSDNRRPYPQDNRYAHSRDNRYAHPQDNRRAYGRSEPWSQPSESRGTRSALTGRPADRSVSRTPSRSSRASSSYPSESRRSVSDGPSASPRRSVTSSRRTFSSREEDLLHPQFGAAEVEDYNDFAREEISSSSSGASSRQGMTRSRQTSQTPTLVTEAPSGAPASAPRPATTIVTAPTPPVIPVEPDRSPVSRPTPAVSTNVPTVMKPSPRVASQAPVSGGPESQDQVLLTRHAPALVVETKGPRQIVVGKEATYHIVLRNQGGVVAGKANVTVQLPAAADIAGLEPSAGEAKMPSASKPDEGVRWQVTGLEAGGSEELALKLVPRDSRALALKVSVHSAPVDSQIKVEVREPRLRLAISGPAEVDYGETVVYELTFSNSGNADAENVMVRLMPIDPGDAADIHRIGTVPAGSKQTVEIELVARQSGTLSIQAEATADSGLRSESRREVIVLRPVLRLDVQGPKFRYARTVATYTIRLTNPGNAPAREVELGAMLPVQAKFISCTGDGKLEEGTSKIGWTVADLPPGGEQVFELKCELEKPGVNRIQVAALADDDLRDANFIATEVQTLADLDLNVVDPKGPIPVGEDVTYEVIIRNRGSKSAENVRVFAFFSDGIEPSEVFGHRHQIESGKVVLEPIPTLAPGEEMTVKITAKAETPGTHVFRAEVLCPSLSAKLSEQETTRFYAESDGDAPAEEIAPPPYGVERSSGREPTRVTPSHPKRLDPKSPPNLRPTRADTP